jgi:hypothetical protein
MVSIFAGLLLTMKRIFFCLVLFSVTAKIQAQDFSITAFGGESNYQGDLQQKRFTFQEAHFAGGAGVMYKITDKLFARTGITFAKVSGNDAKSSYLPDVQRNLNFTSLITEVNVELEYDIFSLDEYNATPYLFLGAAVFHFNPYTYDKEGNKVYLQPLGTEGEGFFDGRKKYALTQMAIPFGGGVKFSLSDNVHLGIEIGLRKLFTDYLDDVSTTYVSPTLLAAHNGAEAVELAFRGDELKPPLSYPEQGTVRGDPKSKDWYYFTGFTLSFDLLPRDEKLMPDKTRKRDCPARVSF